MAPGRIVTLEQFIIDTFTRIDDDGVETPTDIPDQIGGGGTYMIIGARMFLPASRLGMIVHHGAEALPSEMQRKLDTYGPEMWMLQRAEQTCLGLNRYRGDHRSFEYLTPPVLLTPTHLLGTALAHPLPSTLHIISYPPRMEQVLAEIHNIRAHPSPTEQNETWAPRIVWEPDAEPLDVVQRVAGETDIISPNHTELFKFLDIPPPPPATSDSLREEIEVALLDFLRGLHRPPRQAVIVRCSSLGVCYVPTVGNASEEQIVAATETKTLPRTKSTEAPETQTWPRTKTTETLETETPETEAPETEMPETETPETGTTARVRWVPAYWHPGVEGYHAKLVDPTGCGNAFMGGLAAALEQGEELFTAIVWGTVAASYTIEQLGPPALDVRDGVEFWNGEDPMIRVRKFRDRLASEVGGG